MMRIPLAPNKVLKTSESETGTEVFPRPFTEQNMPSTNFLACARRDLIEGLARQPIANAMDHPTGRKQAG